MCCGSLLATLYVPMFTLGSGLPLASTDAADGPGRLVSAALDVAQDALPRGGREYRARSERARTRAQRLNLEVGESLVLDHRSADVAPKDVCWSCALPTPARLFCHSLAFSRGVR